MKKRIEFFDRGTVLEGVSGFFSDVVFSNDDFSYQILKFSPLDDNIKGEITCVLEGFPEQLFGAPVNVKGTIVVHPNYGVQLKLSSIENTPITDNDFTLINYFQYSHNGKLKVGTVTANALRKIYAHDGMSLCDRLRAEDFNGIRNDIRVYNKKHGIRATCSLNAIKEWYATLKYDEEIISLKDALMKFSTRIPSDIDDIRDKLVEQCKLQLSMVTPSQFINYNPYSVVFLGLNTFLRTDARAQKYELSDEVLHFERLKACLYYCLRKTDDGNTAEYKDVLFRRVQEFIPEVSVAELDKVLNSMLFSLSGASYVGEWVFPMGYINLICNGTKVQFGYYTKEESLIKLRMRRKSDVLLPEQQIKNIINNGSYNLTGEQELGVLRAFSETTSIITAGGGYGKSYLTKCIYDIAMKANIPIALLSPTGRAANNLNMVCHTNNASTIHRALLNSDKSNELLRARVIICDEASMIDTDIFSELVSNITPFNGGVVPHLVLIGDPNQLPSVGPGQVFKDLINSDMIPVTRLTHNFRQEAKSKVLEAIWAAQEGNDFIHILPDPFIELSNDLSVVEMDLLLKKYLLPIVSDAYKHHKSIYVLSPTKKPPFIGTTSLNKWLRSRLSVELFGEEKSNEFLDAHPFLPGDRVMQIKNNYDAVDVNTGETVGVFNGDTGIVISASNNPLSVRVRFDDTSSITPKEIIFNSVDENGEDNNKQDPMNNLVLAYAQTVHKAQGGEADTVIIFLTNSMGFFLSRNLLYTALSRAKKRLILFGNRRAYKIASLNNKVVERVTGLN